MDDERKKKDDLGVVLGWLIGKQMAERPTFLAETAFFCWRYHYLEFRAFAPLSILPADFPLYSIHGASFCIHKRSCTVMQRTTLVKVCEVR